MGDFDGGVRHLGGSVQQLRPAAGGEPGDSGGCVRSGLSASSGATFICDYAVAGEDPAGTGNGSKDLEFGLSSHMGLGYWKGSLCQRNGHFYRVAW